MPASPDAAVLAAFLGVVRRRLLVLRLAEGAGAGMAAGALAIALGVGRSTIAAVMLVLLLMVVGALGRMWLGTGWTFGWWRPAPLASLVEQRSPECRNIVLTAAELPALPSSGRYGRMLVAQRAAALVRALDPARLFPAWVPGVVLTAGAALLVLAVRRPAIGAAPGPAFTRAGLATIRRVEVRIVPPPYTGIGANTLVNPSRIEALASSRIEIRVRATAAGVRLETLAGASEFTSRGDEWTANIDADADGFIAVEARGADGAAAPRLLMGLTVTRDRPPQVRVVAPGRDLFFATVPSSLPVRVEADDDIGLASLRLRYTMVSGGGEQFSFTEREVPLAAARPSPRAWSATGTWNLDSLRLEPGDMVVYSAVATDRGPGAGVVASESYVIERVTPGAVAAEGFAADDERDRYAASQQMIILKTERLIEGRDRLAPDSVRAASRLLAAEQRQVRAEFIFMMGGELEDAALETSGTLEVDETAEAEAEGDVLAGRLQNQGRLEMTRAVRAMSRAASLLFEANLTDALRQERVALDNLMRAFSRSRFILRAMSQRERIDLERRLSGALREAIGPTGAPPRPATDPRLAALRRLLAELSAWTGNRSPAATRAVSVAVTDVLRTEPGDELRVLALRVDSLVRASPTALDTERLTSDLVVTVASLLPAAPSRARLPASDAIEGAWRDAMSRGGNR